MNPNAKEFVPARILKQRQEEAERLSDLTSQFSQVDLDNKKQTTDNGQPTCINDDATKALDDSKQAKNNDSSSKNDGSTKSEKPDQNKSTLSDVINGKPDKSTTHGQSADSSNRKDSDSYNNPVDYPDDPSLDEAYLLEKGESLCEFNGEKFIIPGDDDEYIPPVRAGYDFGNDQDNEDEDVCNAFEEFLENLPN